jgi:hypothetical protein
MPRGEAAVYQRTLPFSGLSPAKREQTNDNYAVTSPRLLKHQRLIGTTELTCGRHDASNALGGGRRAQTRAPSNRAEVKLQLNFAARVRPSRTATRSLVRVTTAAVLPSLPHRRQGGTQRSTPSPSAHRAERPSPSSLAKELPCG